MPRTNMYNEVTPANQNGNNANLSSLALISGINSITDQANGLIAGIPDAKKKERFIEYFYDKMLMDTIKLGSENNVFLKHCRVKSVPKGNEKFLLRRWGGLTEHTVPLPEGIPPKSDRMASESFEGTYCQYGRYMEFTDRVEFNLIDDVITHYSMELGDVAVRTAERLCREELEANAGVTYANSKGAHDLVIGDVVGIADYRLQALKFARRLVKPLAGGAYHVICSPEHIYDLVDDPLVDKYMRYTNTAEPYVTGQPVKLFNIVFEETMLDDFAYGYTEMSNPGEFEAISGSTISHALRLVAEINGETYYFNISAGAANKAPASGTIAAQATGVFAGLNVAADTVAIKRTVAEAYLKDGSYIPSKVTYDLAGFLTACVGSAATIPAQKVTGYDANGVPQVTSTNVTVTLGDLTAANTFQLPVHKAFMFGDEFIYKTGIDGEMNAKFYVKAKGSAGVLDPIDQRQSVGFKINTLGFNTVRPEAMVQFIFVPKQALATYKEVLNELAIHYN